MRTLSLALLLRALPALLAAGVAAFHHCAHLVKGNERIPTAGPLRFLAMKKEALAHPLEFNDAGWSVAVSYPGQVWKRVDCSGWC